MPLPSLKDTAKAGGKATLEGAKAVGKTAGDRLGSVASSAKDALNPNKMLSQSFNVVKSGLYSEMPEIGKLSGMVGSLMSDIKGNFGGYDDEIEENTEKTAEESAKTNVFLQSMQDTNNSILHELMTLIDITSSAWDISEKQLETTRALLAFDKNTEQRRKFENQRATAQDTVKSKIPSIKKIEKKDKGFLAKLADFIVPSIVLLGATMKTALMTGLGAIAGAVGLTSVAKKLKSSKAEKKAEKAKKLDKPLNTDKKITKDAFKQVADPVKKPTMGSKITKFAKDAVKPALKPAGRAAKAVPVYGLIASGVIAAITEGIPTFVQEYRESGNLGKAAWKGLYATGEEFIMGTIYLIRDIFKWSTKKFAEWGKKSSEAVSKTFTRVGEGFNNAKENFREFGIESAKKTSDFVSDVWAGFSNFFSTSKAMLLNGIKDWISGIVDTLKIRHILPDSVKDFLNTKEKIPAPIKRREERNQKAVNIISGQDAINKQNKEYNMAMMNRGDTPASVSNPITNVVNNTNVISGNIITRNPRSPLFLKDKVVF